jgi:transcriptional regulator with XRE-family HTH domain
MQDRLTFGEYLRRLRRDKRMPLQDVARQAGLSTTHLSRLENDNGLPTTDTVV